jgi:Sugar transferases involved in lipopolysaccharide synthesis
MNLYKNSIKRFLDIFVSFFALIVLLPVFLLLTITFFFANGGKPFYYQKRPGQKGRIFEVMKFKSMTDKKNSNGVLLPDEQRVTALGKFIRKTSLDEIPQLINVLKGNMSLIGPRPLLIEYMPLYSKEQARRHDIRPGITGWAQVNGRNSISWTDKFALDVWYVDHVTFLLDIKIIYLTIKKVFIREGIDFDKTIVERRFNGDN